MLIAKCDVCNESEEVIARSLSKPKDWSEITVSGVIPTSKGGLSRQSFRKLMCITCTEKIFDLSEEPKKSLSDQFEDAAMGYMNELAITAVEEAMEGGP